MPVLGYTPDDEQKFLDYLKELGQYKLADLTIYLKIPLLPSEVRERTADLEVLHYGIDYADSSEFGYSDWMLQGQTANDYDQLVENVVKEGLDYLTSYFPTYGHLGWENSEYLNTFFRSNQDLRFYDFADIQDYVDYNGVKISTLRVSASSEILAEWLENNREAVVRVELNQLTDVILEGAQIGEGN
ncbi:hypothetical protein [Enterococcus olivae]